MPKLAGHLLPDGRTDIQICGAGHILPDGPPDTYSPPEGVEKTAGQLLQAAHTDRYLPGRGQENYRTALAGCRPDRNARRKGLSRLQDRILRDRIFLLDGFILSGEYWKHRRTSLVVF